MRKMARNLLFTAAISTLTLTACNSKTDANEKNFSEAISQSLSKNGQLCLGHTKWPIDISPMDIDIQKKLPTGTVKQMAALQAVGLVSSTDATVTSRGWSQNTTQQIKRYTLTEAAKPYLNNQGALCWGQRALDKVVKWDAPIKLGDYQETTVTYQYKIDKLADWTKKSDIYIAFPAIQNLVDGAGTKEGKMVLKLTNEGWEAKASNDFFKWE